MGMFDTIHNVPVNCPRCGDEEPKSAQIKCGPQAMNNYTFGEDEIDIDWDYPYYSSIIDKDKKIIGGIATCENCKNEAKEMMRELVQEAKNKGEIKVPEGEESKYLFECEIDEKDALSVISQRLDDIYGGNRNIELFDVAITIGDNNVAISVEPIEKSCNLEI